MTILIFGKSGQVARCLQELAPVIALDRDEADLTELRKCTAAIERHAPTAVINAAAYTAVDRAEEEEELATQINACAPGAIALACAARDLPFVHISTDYVFDGNGEKPWRTSDAPAPMTAYGRSKLGGERAVASAGGRYAILRTSWVFSNYGRNFLKTMLRLGAERERLRVVADQVGGPTPANTIAAACLSIVRQIAEDASKSGTYHFSGFPDTSWAGFAREIFSAASIDCEVADIPSNVYATPAVRPLNSRLDCEETLAKFGIARPDWRAEMQFIVQNILNKDNTS